MQVLRSALRCFIDGLFFLFASTAPVIASEIGIDSGDTEWILSATALVLLMTLPGLALFYAGLVQSKNIVSVLMHHFAIAASMSVLRLIDSIFGLRVDQQDEIEGLDLSQHGERGYHTG